MIAGRNKILKVMSAALIAVVSCSVLNNLSEFSLLRAATEKKLVDVAGSISVGPALNKSNNNEVLSDGQTHDVIYGSAINFTLSWAFDDNTSIEPGDEIVFELPEKSEEAKQDPSLNLPVLKYPEVADKPIEKEGKQVGSLSIKDNKITIVYTDAKFCADKDRAGEMNFDGIIADDGEGGTAAKEVTYNFDQYLSLRVRMVPEPRDKTFDVGKEFSDELSAASGGHYYDCKITVESVGDNTQVQIRDEMYPGMGLRSYEQASEFYPRFYTDSACTVPLDTSRIDSLSASGRVITATIKDMSDGETIYMKYQVSVVDDFYQGWDSANAYLGNLPEGENIYDEGKYIGRVPNSVRVWSNEVDNAVWAWDDVYTLNAGLNKWSNAPENIANEGILSWQLTLYNIKNMYDGGITDFYIIDELPVNTRLVDGSVTVKWKGVVYDDAMTVTYPYNGDDTKVKLTYNDSLIDHLKEDGCEALVDYQLKVIRQDEEQKTYINRATFYYGGTEYRSSIASMSYTRPDPVDKVGLYDQTTAPNIEYEIYVNPASLDLDENSDDLTLTDVLSDTYDLILSTVKVNGVRPGEDMFKFDPDTRTMTFYLKDQTAYTITYEARVNLAQGSYLEPGDRNDPANPGNSVNKVSLTSQGKQIFEDDCRLDSKVYLSAASASSSDNSGSLFITKVDSEVSARALSDAEFTLTEMRLSSSGEVTGTAETVEITDADGQAAFTGLNRGTVYMLRETSAPDGYELDETPRFYVFAAAGESFPSEVTYGGSRYSLMTLDVSRSIVNEFIKNDPVKKPDPVEPTEPSVTESSSEPSVTESSSEPSAAADVLTPTVTPVPTDPASPSESITDPVSTPRTGEEISRFTTVGILILSMSGITAITYYLIRKRKTTE